MKITHILTAAITGLLTASLAHSQQLEQKDYSPTDAATIRTVRIKDLGGGSKAVVVAIKNSSATPFDSNFACTLFDKSGSPFGSADGGVKSVPPDQEVIASTISFRDPIGKAVCRIEFITESH